MLIKETALRNIIRQVIREAKSSRFLNESEFDYLGKNLSDELEFALGSAWFEISNSDDKQKALQYVVDVICQSTPRSAADLVSRNSSWAKKLSGGTEGFQGEFLANVEKACKYALGNGCARVYNDIIAGRNEDGSNAADLWHSYEPHIIDAFSDYLSSISGKRFNANNPSQKADIEGYLVKFLKSRKTNLQSLARQAQDKFHQNYNAKKRARGPSY